MEPNDKNTQKKKRYKMALLFIQTEELKRLYNSEIDLGPKKYYLVNKEWLDNYKNINDYNYSIEMLNSFKDWKDYSDFQQKISKYCRIEDLNLTQFGADDTLDNILNFSLQKEKLPNINFSYPTNCELVKEEFFNDCFKGAIGFPQYEVWIGNQFIIIKDSETQNILFLCSLIESNSNFLIKINYILAFENEYSMNTELSILISLKDINNYLNQRNINKNMYSKQNIFDQNGKRIGVIMPLNENNQNNQIMNNVNKNNYNNFNNQNQQHNQILRSRQNKNNNNNNISNNNLNNQNQQNNQIF